MYMRAVYVYAFCIRRENRATELESSLLLAYAPPPRVPPVRTRLGSLLYARDHAYEVARGRFSAAVSSRGAGNCSDRDHCTRLWQRRSSFAGRQLCGPLGPLGCAATMCLTDWTDLCRAPLQAIAEAVSDIKVVRKPSQVCASAYTRTTRTRTRAHTRSGGLCQERGGGCVHLALCGCHKQAVIYAFADAAVMRVWICSLPCAYARPAGCGCAAVASLLPRSIGPVRMRVWMRGCSLAPWWGLRRRTRIEAWSPEAVWRHQCTLHCSLYKCRGSSPSRRTRASTSVEARSPEAVSCMPVSQMVCGC
jgi:hypothetical protein